ncbi:TIGR04283 family arsenosugar biosynthesis glycosyltransferase [Halomonas saccharevitans]|uniref:TIGR04283 family arsenosugar biosynthesis glycosyltransferase n=1 Tax=Halomonas saccharevitans TaxID=416872 RepID=A0ABU3NES0_9GAMM|nr:TIGR04283 family arsenosugar biosynthesis glycosyltransferase [Halomonas saccharevitans]MDT8879657.1 TIGR04283 family arsenosugar biosynthesis glycosyltransferase [Halomonas saccharevitans]
MPARPRLSIIVPTLNEAAIIEAQLTRLAPLRAGGAELLVVDGGSRDATLARARPLASRVIESAPGRARQMNAGAREAQGRALLFLHADTVLPPGAEAAIAAALAEGRDWGRFDVRLAGRHPLLPVIAFAMNQRSRCTGIATGDQGLFMTREAFAGAGGFPDQPLMEDIEMSRRLKRISKPACLREKVTTSGRRWEQGGAWRTILLMWRLRWRYWRGASPDDLARAYRHVR